MKEFVMKLNQTSQRPIVELKSWYGFEALLDTGALFPIWTASEYELQKLGAILKRKNVTFGGFGGIATGNLWVLPSLIIGDLVYPNMSIIACSDFKKSPFQLILSATMFNNLIYEIDDKDHYLKVTVPDKENCIREVILFDSHGNKHILSQIITTE